MLRLKDGDVIIALGPDEEDHLLLHSNILKAASPFFEANMKTCWSSDKLPAKIVDSSTGKETEVFRYRLEVSNRTATLQLKVRCFETVESLTDLFLHCAERQYRHRNNSLRYT